MKIGVIGTGNMGSVIIHAFIDASVVPPSNLYITNRTKQKAEAIQRDYPDINVADRAEQVARHADILFICVKPLEIHPLLETIADHLSRDTLLVSITSPITTEELESVVDCPTARAIPSITNRALAGGSLISFGASCEQKQKDELLTLMERISTPYVIDNEITRVASDIVCCGPAFFSFLAERFIRSAVQETEISPEEATQYTSQMLMGLGELLKKGIFTFPTLREKVHVRGGVTGVGLSVLEEEVGEMFDHLFQKTHEKYDTDREHVQNQFTNT